MPTVDIMIATIVFFRIKNGDQLFEANPHFYVYRMISDVTSFHHRLSDHRLSPKSIWPPLSSRKSSGLKSSPSFRSPKSMLEKSTSDRSASPKEHRTRRHPNRSSGRWCREWPCRARPRRYGNGQDRYGRNELTDDDVLLEALQVVDLLAQGGFGKHAGGLLEGGCGQPGIGCQRSLGDAHQLRTAGGSLPPSFTAFMLEP